MRSSAQPLTLKTRRRPDGCCQVRTGRGPHASEVRPRHDLRQSTPQADERLRPQVPGQGCPARSGRGCRGCRRCRGCRGSRQSRCASRSGPLPGDPPSFDPTHLPTHHAAHLSAQLHAYPSAPDGARWAVPKFPTHRAGRRLDPRAGQDEHPPTNAGRVHAEESVQDGTGCTTPPSQAARRGGPGTGPVKAQESPGPVLADCGGHAQSPGQRSSLSVLDASSGPPGVVVSS